jgi:hypothetical protein
VMRGVVMPPYKSMKASPARLASVLPLGVAALRPFTR